MPYVQLPDIRMYYEERGQGEPLLLMMGLGANLDYWGDTLWNALATQYRTIAFDNRGAGDTEAGEAPFSVAGFAADSLALLDALDLSWAHVFGCSMGGMIAQEFALQYPQRLRKLVLGCTFCGGSQAVQTSPDVLQMLVTRSDDVAVVKAQTLKMLFTDEFVQNNPEWVDAEWVRISARPIRPESFLRQAMAIQQWQSYTRLVQVSAPTLILHGTEDILIPAENAHILANAIPHSRVRLYEGAGHGFTGQMPKAVAADVLGFLGE